MNTNFADQKDINVVIRTGTSTRAPILLEEKIPDRNLSITFINYLVNPRDYISYVIDQSLRNDDTKRNDSIELKLPVKKVCNTDVCIGEQCSICLSADKFKVGDEVALTPCRHIFHHSCLGQWVKWKAICPLCRKDIPIKN